MIALAHGTTNTGQNIICAMISDGMNCLPSILTEWDDDQLHSYSADDVAPSPIKDAIIAERVRRDKERFKIEQGFTDDDLGTTLFEALFKLWFEEQRL